MKYDPRKNVYLQEHIDKIILKQAKRFRVRGRSGWMEAVSIVLKENPDILKKVWRKIK